MPSDAALRHAPWSLSKVKCALRCPREYGYKYVEKVPEPEVAPDARIGRAVHAALEAVLSRRPVDEAMALGDKELQSDEERQRYVELRPAVDKFAGRIADFRTRRKVTSELFEHKVAVDANLQPTDFKDRSAFYRGVWDAGFVYDGTRLAVVDHKTGARKAVAEYTDQLEGYAMLAAANLTGIQQVWLGVHFVGDAAMEWSAPVELEVVRNEIAPRVVSQIEQAASAVDKGFVPRPSGWCRRCSYRSICPAVRASAAGSQPTDSSGGSGG